jgi:uncharacterized protein with PIN domain
MSWETIAILLVMSVLLLTPGGLREFRSRRCPKCQSCLRKTGRTHIIPQGEVTTWLCPVCGSRTYGDQGIIEATTSA